MRHVAVGRHARYPVRPSRWPYILVILAALAALVTALVLASQPEPAQAANQAPAVTADRGAGTASSDSGAQLAREKAVAARLAAMRVRAAAIAAALTYTVKPGDSLSQIAVRYCGHANDWTGIYVVNRRVIGADPNLVFPGQRLSVTRCTDPPALLRLGSVHRVRAVARARVRHDGRIWGVSRGYPNFCGDGDGDGWDVPCQARTATPVARVRHAVSSVPVSAGTYSFAGLEALWMRAGGPFWAAARAASIAECESGGRVNAWNPSGATGLWQILGSVVPGNLYNPYVNALNAVAKFRASGDTFAQWVCTG